ncbi:methyltransferase [uncultured Bifidobacterium sp.]|uniref:class I SAM-dependent methyltransferase n=1 Tax=uncultured Bifidobacterium sp. TaxID=165187 RepID=UPI00260936C3|nr:methyltransferase [uncultured Bifidobacterium sp.]
MNPHSDATQQYFTADPSSKDERRTLNVSLRGRDTRVEVSNGVFSSHRLDLGTSVLLRNAPQLPSQGTMLDLGCGWGPLALAMAQESPQSQVWAVDVNERALDLTRTNATANGITTIRTALPDDVPTDLTFDIIWSNPPIRVGKDELHELLTRWLPRLTDTGKAYLVVQRNLGSDSLMRWLADVLGSGFDVSKHSSAKGFRIIEVSRAA